MSTQPTDQINTVFDLHRSFVTQQVNFTRDAFEAQQQMLETAADGLDTWRDLAEQQTAFAAASAEHGLEQLPEDVDGTEEIETFIEESLAQFEEATEMSFEATEEAIDEAAASYARFVESYLDTLEAGVDSYLEATENVEAATEEAATEIDVE